MGTWFRLAMGMALSLFLAGCGGTAGSGNPNQVTVRFVDFFGAAWTPPRVAVQTGNGAWQSVNPQSTLSLTLPSGEGRYGVAYQCWVTTQVYQLSVSEATSLILPCPYADPSAAVTVSLSYNDSAFPAASQRRYAANTAGAAFGAFLTNPTSVSVPPGEGDLVAALYDSSDNLLAVKALLNQNLSNGASFSFSFAASDAVSGTGNTAAYAVPAGFTTGGTTVYHVTPAGAAAILKDDSSAPGKAQSFPLPPSAVPGQRVVLAEAHSSGLSLKTYEAFSASGYTPTLPPVFNPSVDTSAAIPTFSGLNASGSDFRGYTFMVNAPMKYLTAVVSKGWIGSASSYTPPDLKSLGFYYLPASGDQVLYDASSLYGNQSIDQYLGNQNLWKVLAKPGVSLKLAMKEGTYTAP